MQLVPEPYFVSPHAVKRYTARIKKCREIEAIHQIQIDLQTASIVERFLDKRVYDCQNYFALVGPPAIPREQDWPTVITIIDTSMYHPIHKPVYGKPNPWRESKIDIWLPAEKHYLRCHWGYIPSRIIARHLGRTPKAVQQQAYKLKLTKKQYHKWNKHEIEILKWFYSSTTINLTTELLGRSVSSVKAKAHTLKLSNKDIPVAWAVKEEVYLNLCEQIKRYIEDQLIHPRKTFVEQLLYCNLTEILWKEDK